MTLAQLRYTIAIAKAGSMNEAAKSLYISQPSLSTAIRELEAETGVEIFRRTNRGIAVTPAGEEFLGYARHSMLGSCLTNNPSRMKIVCAVSRPS